MFSTSDSSFLTHRSLHLWKKIGEGSFSKVYLAKFGDIDNDKTTLIATKVINKNRVSTKFVEKFLPRELDVIIKLRHPFIVQVYSVFQNGYKIYINMEYAENGDMFTYLQKTKLTEEQIRSWLLQILWAFSYMHNVGVVHRDLKCENILLTGRYNLRIADFGFARFVDRGRNPGAYTVCGTMTYSAPELLYGKRPYNPIAADVWAIGVVLFIMSNNVPPFRNSNKENLHKKQMDKNFAFRRSLVRSRTLKDLTATFLEPNFQKRTKIKTALQHPWIKEGNIKIPANVIVANESITTSLSQPIVTETSLKVPAFHYQLSEYGKPISADNDLFTAVAAENEVINPKSKSKPKHKPLKLKK